jgi:hypothetical protein
MMTKGKTYKCLRCKNLEKYESVTGFIQDVCVYDPLVFKINNLVWDEIKKLEFMDNCPYFKNIKNNVVVKG